MVGKTAVFNTDQVSLTQGQAGHHYANLSRAAPTSPHDTGRDWNTVRTIGRGMRLWEQYVHRGMATTTMAIRCPPGPTPYQLGHRYQRQIRLPDSKRQRAYYGVIFNNGTPQFVAGGSTLQLSDISQLDE